MGVARSLAIVKGTLQRNRIDAYWYIGERNFGDLLTPALLRLHGMTPVHSAVECARLFCVGSILEVVPKAYSGVILGSGLIRRQPVRLPQANILSVRGVRTRELLGLPVDTPLGDPGLLAGAFAVPPHRKRFLLGLVPHYVDSGDPRIHSLCKRFAGHATVVDVKSSPSVVLRRISECQYIASSSLHGLIAADALGIPSVWIELSKKVIGDGFKFEDYNSALDSSHVCVALSGTETLDQILRYARPPPAKIGILQQQLRVSFEALRNVYDSLR